MSTATETLPMVKLVAEQIPHLIQTAGVTGFAVTTVIVADAVCHPDAQPDDRYVSRLTADEIADRCGITSAMCHRAIARLLDAEIIGRERGRFYIWRVT